MVNYTVYPDGVTASSFAEALSAARGKAKQGAVSVDIYRNGEAWCSGVVHNGRIAWRLWKGARQAK